LGQNKQPSKDVLSAGDDKVQIGEHFTVLQKRGEKGRETPLYSIKTLLPNLGCKILLSLS
jgi:hypothetical protein